MQNFKDLALNFNYAAGHLWFVYMIVGLYLLMPLLSPWAEKVGRKELLFFLGLCFLTSFIPFIREAAIGADAVCVEGSLGLMTTPVEIILTAVSSYVTAAVFCVLVQRIPVVGKWIVG